MGKNVCHVQGSFSIKRKKASLSPSKLQQHPNSLLNWISVKTFSFLFCSDNLSKLVMFGRGYLSLKLESFFEYKINKYVEFIFKCILNNKNIIY